MNKNAIKMEIFEVGGNNYIKKVQRKCAHFFPIKKHTIFDLPNNFYCIFMR